MLICICSKGFFWKLLNVRFCSFLNMLFKLFLQPKAEPWNMSSPPSNFPLSLGSFIPMTVPEQSHSSEGNQVQSRVHVIKWVQNAEKGPRSNQSFKFARWGLYYDQEGSWAGTRSPVTQLTERRGPEPKNSSWVAPLMWLLTAHLTTGWSRLQLYHIKVGFEHRQQSTGCK